MILNVSLTGVYELTPERGPGAGHSRSAQLQVRSTDPPLITKPNLKRIKIFSKLKEHCSQNNKETSYFLNIIYYYLCALHNDNIDNIYNIILSMVLKNIYIQAKPYLLRKCPRENNCMLP